MRKPQPRSGRSRIQGGELAVVTFADLEEQDRAYWKRQTPQARLRAMELMRRINYGQAAAGRLQRLLEVVQSEAR
ncbi:MAG: hypothetical protein HYR84_17180 [Planctomycetes bacterium]|nr:hypothetical protein [Planctomycetota bacterium]